MAYSHTVVGIFENDFAAEDLVDILIKNGFDRKDIDIRNHWDINGPSFTGGSGGEHKHLSSLASFFKSIFEGNKEDAEMHYKVAAEGCAVVAVYVNSREEAIKASGILDDNGAINVKERVAQNEESLAGGTGISAESRNKAWASSAASPSGHFHLPILTKHETEFASSNRPGRLTEEEFRELKGKNEGTRSHISEWQGEPKEN